MNLEEICKKLFERCSKDIERLFFIRNSEIKIVPSGDGLSNKDTIRVYVYDKVKWKQVCEVYPATSKVEFNEDYCSTIRLSKYIKDQLKYYNYFDIKENEWFDPSKAPKQIKK